MADHIYLAHHGIKGMKWGVRRFQNKDGTLTPAGKERYDLDGSASVSKDASSSSRNSRRAKQIAKGAAIAAGVLLAVYGGYKLSQLRSKETSTGSSIVDDFLHNTSGRTSPAIGKSIGDIDRAMVSRINQSNGGREGEINCAHTSMAYILNSVFGQNVRAQGFSGVDEASGLVRNGRSKKIFDAAFDGVRHIQPPASESFERSVERIPNSSTGVLYVRGGGLAHFLNYERDSAGVLTLVDTQQHDARTQIMAADSPAYRFLSRNVGVSEILDFSNASISENAGDVFKHCVKGG